MQLYMREVARYPLLTPEEEYELAVESFDKGDPQAAHRLVTSNLRLVVKIAHDFRNSRVNLLDLVQEGNYGLMQAVKRFNPYKGVKLSSYAAWWIKAYILKFLMDSQSQVRIGTTAAQRKLYFNLRKETEKLLQEYERVDTKLLAEKFEVDEKEVIEMQQRLSGPDLSLDTPISEDGSLTIEGTLVEKKEGIDDELGAKQVLDIFGEHLDEFRRTLKGRDLEIFDARLIAEEPLTLQQIGDRYGITRERARQVEARIMKSLKDFVKKKGVIDDLIEV